MFDGGARELSQSLEVGMIVSVLKMRAKSPEAAREICRIFSEWRSLSIEAGWLRCSCLTNVKDRQEVYVHEHWGNLAAWEAWERSASRQALFRQLAPLLEGPVELDIYD
jgi:quinol monooxygenase YgiN